MSDQTENDGEDVNELIAFRIAEQDFCFNIMSVREIRGWTPATVIPHAPSYVRGVINLRGAVVPIVDLAARLGLEVPEPTVARRAARGVKDHFVPVEREPVARVRVASGRLYL